MRNFRTKVLSRQDPILSVTVACRFFARGDFARAQARPSRSKLRALPGRCRISVRQYRRTRDSSLRSTPSAEVPPSNVPWLPMAALAHLIRNHDHCILSFGTLRAAVGLERVSLMSSHKQGVVAGLVPAIHVSAAAQANESSLDHLIRNR